MRILPIALCCAFACGGPSKVQSPAAPPAPDQKVMPDHNKVIEEAAQLFFESGQVIIDAGGDCRLMATSVGTWIDKTRARRHEMNESLQAIDSEANAKHYRDALAQRFDIVVGLKAGLELCLPDKDFRKVWERLDA